MYTNRKPYYQLKKSMSDFFSGYSRFLKQSLEKESVAEKPYLEGEYPQMHLNKPGFKFEREKRKALEIPTMKGAGVGLKWVPHKFFWGEAECKWDIFRGDNCLEGSNIITIFASYFWETEFNFGAAIVKDTIGGVVIRSLPDSEANAQDKQDFSLIFPENANGTVTVCGSAFGFSLLTSTYRTIAGFPVSMHVGRSTGIFMLGPVDNGLGGYTIGEAQLIGTTYGSVGNECGCIDITSSCLPPLPECYCAGISIGYTSTQMAVDEEQTLTVVGAIEGCTYSWAIASGDGSLSSGIGTTVTYTAPADNPECDKNPTITLSISGSVCDSLSIAVTAITSGTDIAVMYCCTRSAPYTNYHCYNYAYCYSGWRTTTECGSYYNCELQGSSAYNSCAFMGYAEGVTDLRTPEMITAGCCPAELL